MKFLLVFMLIMVQFVYAKNPAHSVTIDVKNSTGEGLRFFTYQDATCRNSMFLVKNDNDKKLSDYSSVSYGGGVTISGGYVLQNGQSNKFTTGRFVDPACYNLDIYGVDSGFYYGKVAVSYKNWYFNLGENKSDSSGDYIFDLSYSKMCMLYPYLTCISFNDSVSWRNKYDASLDMTILGDWKSWERSDYNLQ